LQYGVVHISAGDLLRAEIAAGTENGKQAKEFMEKGQLVPDEIVVNVSAIFFFGGGGSVYVDRCYWH
jgi:adenylate kinase family enzyme